MFGSNWRASVLAGAVVGSFIVGVTGAAAQLLDRSQVIKIVVPYTAGGPSDIYARLLGQRVQAAGGPTVVVENKPGGGQVVGALAVKQAAPDGLTLFMTDLPTFAINKALMKDLPYDPLTDFKPVATIFSFPSLLLVPAGLPAKNVAELVELGKKTPGGLAFATQGPGSGGHILGEMFGKATGIQVTPIHYRGGAAAYPDVIAGRVSFIFGGYAAGKPFMEANQLRALAVPARKRIPQIPDVPTLHELGYLDVDMIFWYGLVAPARTPDTVIARLRELFVKEIEAKEVVNRLNNSGLDMVSLSPAEFTALIKKDIDRVAPIVKASGATQN